MTANEPLAVETSALGAGTLYARLRHERGTLRARVVDISCGGAGVLAAQPLPMGTPVTLTLGGESGPVSACRTVPATVCYSAPIPGGRFRLGIEFLPADEPTTTRLAQIVKRFERRQARRAPVWQT